MSVKLRIKEYKSKRKTYYLDIWHNGKRHYEFLEVHIERSDPNKKEKKELAESIRAKREIELTSSDYDIVPKHKRRVDFVAYYENYSENYTRADKRIVKYSFEKFLKFLGGKSIQVNQIDYKIVRGFKEYLESRESGLTGETPYNYFTRFRRVLKEGYLEGILTKEQYFMVSEFTMKRQGNTLKKNVLTIEELKKLSKAVCGNEQVKKAFLFACYTGLGEAEIRKLTWSRIQNNRVILFREKSGEQIINDLNAVALRQLPERGGKDELIFHLPSNVAVLKGLKNWVKRAEIDKKISFYCGRHTFAVQLLTNGANLKTVADCLGQTSTKHTLKYLNFVDELKSNAILNLPDIE